MTAVLAVSGSCAQFGLVQAFRYGEVSVLAPLEYSALIWATLFGHLFWGDLPTTTVLGGVAIIVGSSAYVAHREARTNRLVTGPTRDLIQSQASLFSFRAEQTRGPTVRKYFQKFRCEQQTRVLLREMTLKHLTNCMRLALQFE